MGPGDLLSTSFTSRQAAKSGIRSGPSFFFFRSTGPRILISARKHGQKAGVTVPRWLAANSVVNICGGYISVLPGYKLLDKCNL